MLLTTLQLDATGALPMYRQLIAAVKEGLQTGRLSPGEKLPSIRSLAQALGVSRITVENAYSQLLDEGYLVSRPKQGYYAADLRDLYPPPAAVAAPLGAGPQGSPGQPGGQSQAQQSPQYNFRSNAVDSASFNMPVWRRYLHYALRETRLLTSYGPAQGEPRLLYTLAKYSGEARDVKCTPRQIVVGAGTQSLLHILCGILTAEQCPIAINTVGIQAPGFFQAEQIFRDHHLPIRSFSLAELEEADCSLPELVCINPSNPYRGEAVTRAVRLRLLRRCAAQNTLLLEDDYIGEFRYLLRPLPSLQSLSGGDNVIYLGSFSRTMVPSLRISYMVLPELLLPAYEQIGHRYNQTASGMEQLALAEFIGDGHLNRHIRRLRRMYAAKSQALRQALQRLPQDKVTVPAYESGLRLLLLVESTADATALAQLALARGVAVIPLAEALPNPKGSQYPPLRQLMLSYAGIPEQDILPAVSALAQAWLPQWQAGV